MYGFGGRSVKRYDLESSLKRDKGRRAIREGTNLAVSLGADDGLDSPRSDVS